MPEKCFQHAKLDFNESIQKYLILLVKCGIDRSKRNEDKM